MSTKSWLPGSWPSTLRRGVASWRSNITRLNAIAASKPLRMPSASTASTAASTTRRSRFHCRYGLNTDSRHDLLTAWITMAASTGSGIRSIQRNNSNTISSMVAAATSPASRERAPAASFAEVPE